MELAHQEIAETIIGVPYFSVTFRVLPWLLFGAIYKSVLRSPMTESLGILGRETL